MPWIRLDDGFADHPKIAQVGPIAAWLHVKALVYCGRYLTDGKIPRAIVASLVDWRTSGVFVDRGGNDFTGTIDHPDNLDLAAQLVEAGVWHETKTGYEIHDYLSYQPSKAKVTSEREATRERVNKFRGKKPGNGSCNGVTNAVGNVNSNGVNNAPVTPLPIPIPVSLSPARARVMGADVLTAWGNASLPGLPGAGVSELAEELTAIGLSAAEACAAFKRIIDGWRTGRNVVVSPTVQKMRDHLGLVHQVVRGEVDPSKFGAATSDRGGKSHEPPMPKELDIDGMYGARK